MPGLTHEDDDDNTATLIDPANPDAPAGDEDNGNGPTKAELQAEALLEAAATGKVKAPAADADQEADGHPAMIPKGRFNEVITQKNTLADQLAQAQATIAALVAGKAAPAQADQTETQAFDRDEALQEQYEAIQVGDKARAIELGKRIQQDILREATESAVRQYEAKQETLTQQQQAQSLKQTAAELTAKYPQLDVKGEDADQDAIDFVVARRDRLMAEGKPAHEALRLAVSVAAKRFGFDDEPAPTKTDPTADRLLAARQRNAAAAATQPPELGGKGNRATAIARLDVEKMTDAEFAALPEAEKKRLRGDM